MEQNKVLAIFKRLLAKNPQPTTELIYASPFELLIAVILSAHATDKSVNIATKKLFTDANTAKAIFQLGEEKLKSYIKNVGLYNAKAGNIIKTCKILHSEYNGEVPHSREVLESLPGVGRKTANVILNTVFGEPTVAVDTHIFRVANRTKIAPGKNVLQVEKQLLQVIPKKYIHDAHHSLILHGRYTCVARKPKCHECVINDLCEFEAKTH